MLRVPLSCLAKEKKNLARMPFLSLALGFYFYLFRGKARVVQVFGVTIIAG